MDFIHVMDLANVHDKALNYLVRNAGNRTFNVGTGIGYSTLEIVRMFEEVNNLEIAYQIVDKYLGDYALNCVDPSEAVKDLAGKQNVVCVKCVKMHGDGRMSQRSR